MEFCSLKSNSEEFNKIRIKEHETDSVPQTRRLRPIKLIYYAAFVSKKKALDFEKYLKTASGFGLGELEHFVGTGTAVPTRATLKHAG